MKYYAQLYRRNLLTAKTVEALGSFSVCIIDGRLSMPNMIEIGENLCIRENALDNTINRYAIVKAVNDRLVDTEENPSAIVFLAGIEQ